MTDTPLAVDVLLFVVLPYVAVVVFAIGTAERLRAHAYSWTSHSTQFLENRRHFWAIVPFHYGLIAVLVFHAVALVAPAAILRWNAAPARLYAFESVALIAGLLALVGFVGAALRRATVPLVREATRRVDWLVYAVLLVQIASGLGVATTLGWGSSWLAAVGAPYFWSLVRLRPDVTVIAALPLLVKVHIASAYVLLAIVPFSRLVHVISVPNAYLWRRPQVVRWDRRREPGRAEAVHYDSRVQRQV